MPMTKADQRPRLMRTPSVKRRRVGDQGLGEDVLDAGFGLFLRGVHCQAGLAADLGRALGEDDVWAHFGEGEEDDGEEGGVDDYLADEDPSPGSVLHNETAKHGPHAQPTQQRKNIHGCEEALRPPRVPHIAHNPARNIRQRRTATPRDNPHHNQRSKVPRHGLRNYEENHDGIDPQVRIPHAEILHQGQPDHRGRGSPQVPG